MDTTTSPLVSCATEHTANALDPPPDGSTLVMIECTYGSGTAGRSTKASTCGSLKARTVSSALTPMLSRRSSAWHGEGCAAQEA